MVFRVKMQRTSAFLVTSPEAPEHDHLGGDSNLVKVT